MFHRLRPVALTVLVAAVLIACGPDDNLERTANPATGAAAATIVIDAMAFSPRTVEIAAGEAVGWTWEDDTAHDVAFDDDVASPMQKAGTWQRTFDRPGSYEYVCSLHPNMRGTVLVR